VGLALRAWEEQRRRRNATRSVLLLLSIVTREREREIFLKKVLRERLEMH
jgi:hypothetical protein